MTSVNAKLMPAKEAARASTNSSLPRRRELGQVPRIELAQHVYCGAPQPSSVTLATELMRGAPAHDS